jgi:hypothetical protein
VKETHISLILNKKDMMEAKIPTSPLSVIFPEYAGGDSVEFTLEFIKEQFLARVPEHQHRIRIFFINSTVESIEEVLINIALKEVQTIM